MSFALVWYSLQLRLFSKWDLCEESIAEFEGDTRRQDVGLCRHLKSAILLYMHHSLLPLEKQKENVGLGRVYQLSMRTKFQLDSNIDA